VEHPCLHDAERRFRPRSTVCTNTCSSCLGGVSSQHARPIPSASRNRSPLAAAGGGKGESALSSATDARPRDHRRPATTRIPKLPHIRTALYRLSLRTA
jgi:hypothetical protein